MGLAQGCLSTRLISYDTMLFSYNKTISATKTISCLQIQAAIDLELIEWRGVAPYVWLHRNALQDFRECLHTHTKYKIKEAKYKNMPVAWKSRLSVSFYFLITWQPMWCTFINLIQKKILTDYNFSMNVHRLEKTRILKKHIFLTPKIEWT